ncbi:MaoC family dehydratase N-terminal domain-containing protein [Streptomyces sp. NPDC058665]|uniref:FAS1-like dehydratase domain-containing protein n=1 Tax=Streptomyces sp. NPDC058665 TaxID=3346586 RepID=UPI00366A3DC8
MRTDVIGRDAVDGLAALLGVPPASPDLLPPMWHLTQLLEVVPQALIGPDGHPLVGLPTPPAAGARRMFAGGRVWHRRPLLVGREATRTSRILASREVEGRSGHLRFVTVRHEYVQDGELAVRDDHEIVYRPERPAGTPLIACTGGPEEPGAPGPGTVLRVDPVVLFRFSALTCNAHRIHYDRDHARGEGFDHLVVHGPLQAVLMAEDLRRRGCALLGRVFSYRLLAPAVGPQTIRARRPGDGTREEVEVTTGAGGVSASGSLSEPDRSDPAGLQPA